MWRPAGLPRDLRLRRPADFRRVLGQRQGLQEGPLRIAYRPNGLGHPRLGLALAKRLLPRAVDRNRIKRLVRESFRQRRSRLPALDLVVLARPGLLELDPGQLRQRLDRVWDRLAAVRVDEPS